MAGYIRQSVADIINGANITAPPLNAEFNQLAAAFHGTSGHTHDGGTGNGPKIDLTTSISGYLPAVHGGVGGRNNTTATSNPIASNDVSQGYSVGSIWINLTNGRVFICLSNGTGAAVWAESVGIVSDVITPRITGTVDIGTSTFAFRNAHFTNTVTANALTVSGISTDTLFVALTSTFTGLPTFNGGILVNGLSTL